MGHSQACSQVSQWAPGALLRSAAGAVAGEAEPFTGPCPPGRRAGQGGTAGPPGSLCFRCRAGRTGGLCQSSALPPAPRPHKDARSSYRPGRRPWSGLGALCPPPLASRPPAVPTTQGSSILLLPWDSLVPLLCLGAPS